MLWSKLYAPLTREVSKEAVTISHQLMLKAGMIHQVMAGVYSFAPMGLMVLRKIEQRIRYEMNLIGAQEVWLSILQPKELWDKTGRMATMDSILMKIAAPESVRRSNEVWLNKVVLGPTHEEIITSMVSHNLKSYKQLPVILYQIQTKFRNELRPEGGLIRTREFLMKDAYSFHASQDTLDMAYDMMKGAYHRIFSHCGLTATELLAASGEIGGTESHEFIVGDLEVGHIFKLGDKYSSLLDAKFMDQDNKRKPLLMGCYGIGIGRLIAAILEQHHDDKGIKWPKSISPYNLLITQLDVDDDETGSATMRLTQRLLDMAQSKELTVLVDDRKERPGVKFAEGEMIGIPTAIRIGKKGLSQNTVQLVDRQTGNSQDVDIDPLLELNIVKFYRDGKL